MQQSLGFEVTLGSSFSGGRECCINLDMHGHASQVCQAECFSTRGLCHLPKRASVVDLRLRDCSAASVSTASFVEQSRLHALVLTIDLRADLGRLAVRRAGVGRRQQPDRVCKHQTITSALPRPPGESTALERVAARDAQGSVPTTSNVRRYWRSCGASYSTAHVGWSGSVSAVHW